VAVGAVSLSDEIEHLRRRSTAVANVRFAFRYRFDAITTE
jgi:hypothetical protein